MNREEMIKLAEQVGDDWENMPLADQELLIRYAALVEAEVEGKWKRAVVDELMTCHIYTAAHENDPRKALQTLGDYRSAMNAIHERMSPTHMGEPVLRERPCTCHPDDNPPKPCAKRYALSECKGLKWIR